MYGYFKYDPADVVKSFRESVFKKYKITIPEDDPMFLEVELMAALVESVMQQYQNSIAGINQPLGRIRSQYEKREQEALERFSKRTGELTEALAKTANGAFRDAIRLTLDEVNKAAEARFFDRIQAMFKEQHERIARQQAVTLAIAALLAAAVGAAACLL